jgi:4-amino-4-deoxychorismate lyase
VFETLRVYNGKPAFLAEHLTRLKKGAETIFLKFPDLDYTNTISALLNENKLKDAYLRISLFKQREETGILIYVDKFTYYPDEIYRKGFTLIASPFRRHPESIYLKVKSISYLESRLAWAHAQQKNKDEALFLSTEGYVQEGSRSNIFFVQKGTIFTPALECGLLDGITRNQAMRVAKSLDYPVQEGKFTLSHLFSAEEVFLTSSLMEIMPVREVEDHPVGTGPITLRLLQEYRNQIS